MTRPKKQGNTGLPRRHWLVLALSALSGCGGGSSGAGSSDSSGGAGHWSGSETGADAATQVAGAPGTGGTGSGAQGSLPGTGGTGIFSHGTISAFGSVVLNGIHFDETGAQIHIDGGSAGRGALRLGMVAGVQGERFADGLTGRADSIEVWSVAMGRVSASQAGQFTVLGMTIKTFAGTFWEGAGPSGPAVGQWVSVWGLQGDAGASVWNATRVAVVSASNKVVATGMVSGTKDKPTLNGLLLTGSDAKKLHMGSVTRIEGELSGGASQVEVSSHHELDVRGENASSSSLVEIEGVVTSLLGGNRFLLGSVTVDASAIASQYATLKTGMKIEVYGIWQGQLLKATEIEQEDD